MIRLVPVSTRVTRRAFLTTTGRGLALTMLLGGCRQPIGQAPLLDSTAATGVPSQTAAPPTAPSATIPPDPQPSNEPLPDATADAHISLDVKIGQMLLLGFRGLDASDDLSIINDIRDYHLGSVVLFDYDVPLQSPVRNIQSAEQVRALIAGLQAAAEIPLLVTVDQEGGSVARLKEAFGFPPTVSARALGQANDIAHTRDVVGVMARTLHDLGFNLNLAPVVDLDINPESPAIGKINRSFGADPAVVTAQAQAFVEAHHEQGVLCTLKHFPGHGSAAADSHLGLVDVTTTWAPVELEPYQALIGAGIVDAIMTAHVFNAKLDPDYPATLSKPVITGILREQLGYDGVVLCDDMQMGAIREQYGFETAVEHAILAGVDIITLGNNTVYEDGIAGRAFAVIKQAVEDGRIGEERIDQSYRRIQTLKRRATP